MNREDLEKLIGIMESSKRLPEEALKLPLPKRFALDLTQDYYKSFLGNFLPVIDTLLEDANKPFGEIAKAIVEDTGYTEWLNELKVTRESLEQMLQMRKFQLEKSPIFTYRGSLCLKLNDMDIGSKVPMKLIRPPYNHCYFEFGPASERGSLGYKTFALDTYHILEGAYVSFHENADKAILSSTGISTLSIDKNEPLKCIEISFTASPLSMPREKQSVFADIGTYISIYWTDEDQTIEETLNKHFRMFEKNRSIPAEMVESLKENIVFLAKAILYLISGNRYQEIETPEKTLSRRIDALKNPAKVRKLLRQKYTRYDRILIGPDSPYVPLAERLKRVSDRRGFKPHIRRAHWSSRWSGPKKSILKPVQIDVTLVNAVGLSDDDISIIQKDYDVK